MSVVESVRRFLADDLGIANTDEIDPDTPLVRRGVIDSIELMQVVAFLEKTYDIRVDETEVVPGNFRSLAAMSVLVDRKRG